ncbi:hypothetical protein VKT23_012461 [Stygiomarasmius scandens]|uniref:Cytochrome P450 n=1 Tax=Marasmiellus scandens TaxID=2682957 RepID=A0ABR1J650_9AGAR
MGFLQSIYSIVWQETTHALTDWFSELDSKLRCDNNEITFHTIQSFSKVGEFVESTSFNLIISNKLAFLIFLRAGFGEDSSQTALQTILADAFRYSAARAVIPDWLFSLTNRVYVPILSPYLRKTIKVYDDLEDIAMGAVSRMRAEILDEKMNSNRDADRKASSKGGALLRNLVEANIDIDEEKRDASDRHSLTDKELLSNIFIFFLAGYGKTPQAFTSGLPSFNNFGPLETTASVISFACALLALYPDIQQKVFEEVSALWPEGAPANADEKEYKECFPKLTYTTAVFNETLRFQPMVSRLGRVVTKDTALKTYRFVNKGPDSNLDFDIEPVTIPVREGSNIIIDVQGVHRNPVYWGSDADEFKPERFIDSDTYRWPRDALERATTTPTRHTERNRAEIQQEDEKTRLDLHNFGSSADLAAAPTLAHGTRYFPFNSFPSGSGNVPAQSYVEAPSSDG